MPKSDYESRTGEVRGRSAHPPAASPLFTVAVVLRHRRSSLPLLANWAARPCRVLRSDADVNVFHASLFIPPERGPPGASAAAPHGCMRLGGAANCI
ncbi:Methyltransf_2 domain-containing protein [Psidium guajava]|nr:Methyltransf_2 domain-containing protein [Psidium guajava]